MLLDYSDYYVACLLTQGMLLFHILDRWKKVAVNDDQNGWVVRQGRRLAVRYDSIAVVGSGAMWQDLCAKTQLPAI